MKKEVIKVIEELGWGFKTEDGIITMQNGSNLGEDLSFCVDDDENSVDEIISRLDSFDADENAKMWIGCIGGDSGVPDDILGLVTDSEETKVMFDLLSSKIKEIMPQTESN